MCVRRRHREPGVHGPAAAAGGGGRGRRAVEARGGTRCAGLVRGGKGGAGRPSTLHPPPSTLNPKP